MRAGALSSLGLTLISERRPKLKRWLLSACAWADVTQICISGESELCCKHAVATKPKQLC